MMVSRSGEIVLVTSSLKEYFTVSALSQLVPTSPPIPNTPLRNSVQMPTFPLLDLLSWLLELERMCSWTGRAERSVRDAEAEVVREEGELRESSGERGERIMLPRVMGPLGGMSRVGVRKYVFDIVLFCFVLMERDTWCLGDVALTRVGNLI